LRAVRPEHGKLENDKNRAIRAENLQRALSLDKQLLYNAF
jgi:hypothetical protein